MRSSVLEQGTESQQIPGAQLGCSASNGTSLQVPPGPDRLLFDFVRNQESEAAEAGSQRHSFANMAHIATEQHQQLHQESSDNTKTFVIEGYFSMSMIMK